MYGVILRPALPPWLHLEVQRQGPWYTALNGLLSSDALMFQVDVGLKENANRMTWGRGGLKAHYMVLIPCPQLLSLKWWVNSLVPEKFPWTFSQVIFKQILVIDGWDISREIALIMNVTGLRLGSVNIGSGNGLVPSVNKPLPEPMLTHIYVAIWCH